MTLKGIKVSRLRAHTTAGVDPMKDIPVGRSSPVSGWRREAATAETWAPGLTGQGRSGSDGSGAGRGGSGTSGGVEMAAHPAVRWRRSGADRGVGGAPRGSSA